jgi:response regulator of citrate/malate metabolism
MNTTTIAILLIDDDADYAEIIKRCLHQFQNKKFDVTRVTNGIQALEHLNAGSRTDIILMDHYFSNTNGIEVIKKLFEEHNSLPIILLTSNKDYRIAIEVMKYGVEDYLIKEELTDTMLPRTVLNVLERVELNKRLTAIEKDKLITQKKVEAVQELVVTMCHEFNNPLAAIKISTDILMRQASSTGQKEILAKLNTNINHLEKQIFKLRDLNIEKQITDKDPVREMP